MPQPGVWKWVLNKTASKYCQVMTIKNILGEKQQYELFLACHLPEVAAFPQIKTDHWGKWRLMSCKEKTRDLRRAKLLVPAILLLHTQILCHFAEFGNEQSVLCSPKTLSMVFRTLFHFMHLQGCLPWWKVSSWSTGPIKKWVNQTENILRKKMRDSSSVILLSKNYH